MRRIKMIWDFRGPNSKPTAGHHVIHLQEFVANHKLPETIVEISEVNEMHTIAFLVIDETYMKMIRDRLKPHRGQLYISS